MSPPHPQVSAEPSGYEEIPIFVESQCLRAGKRIETDQLFYIQFLENARLGAIYGTCFTEGFLQTSRLADA